MPKKKPQTRKNKHSQYKSVEPAKIRNKGENLTYEKFFKRSMASKVNPSQNKRRANSADGASIKVKNNRLGKFLRPKIQAQSHGGTQSYEIDVVEYSEDDLKRRVFSQSEFFEMKSELHTQRLKNAEQRQTIAKMARQLDLKEKEQKQTKLESLKLQVQRERDLIQFKQQQAVQDRLEARCNTQDQEMRQMRKVLTQTIEIKMQYEAVL